MPEPAPKSPTFTGTYEPVRVPPLYRVASVGVLVMVVLQVALYVGLVAAAGWGVVWWAQHGLFMFEGMSEVRGRGAVWLGLLRAAGYGTPLLAGAVLTITLAAPLIPRRREEYSRVSLDKTDHARTYAYVNQLCEIMGAPRPARIDVMCQPNAGAALEGGMFGMLFGRRPVLLIGLSLAAGMRASELTGIIAHELGHFTQGAGMRSTRVIDRLNGWFAHAVYHRGFGDDLIEAFFTDTWWPLEIMGFLCRIVVGLVRLILMGFLYVSVAMSMFLLRRMEFAADACETRIAGSRNAVWATSRLQELVAGYDRAVDSAQELYHQQRKLPDDLPRMSVRLAPRAKRRPDGFIAGFKDKTKWYHTHPATTDRVAAMLRANEPGILGSDGPAHRLFDGFDDLCKIASAHFYLSVLEDDYDDKAIIPLDRALNVGNAEAPTPTGPRDISEVEQDDPDAPIPLV